MRSAPFARSRVYIFVCIMKLVFYLISKPIFVCINHRIRLNLIICDVHRDIIEFTDEKPKVQIEDRFICSIYG